MACVVEARNRPNSATGLLRLATKLKRTKLTLRALNKNVFGRVDIILKDLEMRLQNIEHKLQLRYSQEFEVEYLVTKIEIQIWENRKATRLDQIAKKMWMAKGD